MTIRLDDLAFLTSAPGEHLLARLKAENLGEAHTLALITRLRKDHTAEQARAGLEMARLRVKAVEKFGAAADRMFFTRDALEQASDPLIRRWRRAANGSGQHVFDVCCGIGSDSLAFAESAASVTGIDLDPVRVEMARLNAAALGKTVQFAVADAHTVTVPPETTLVFFDPARRDDDGKRIYDVERYQPPLSLIRTWKAFRLFAKLSPGVDVDQVRPYGGTLEFISVNGDLKEASLGVLLNAPLSPLRVQAALITETGALLWSHGDDPAEPRLSAPRAWLIEPDAALIRAGLVADAALRWEAFQLDETIAYLIADQRPNTPWARAWPILDWMPFNLKHLRDYLRTHRVGTVTVKKRGTAVTPDTLIPQLKLKGSESRTLVLTRCNGAQIVMVCADTLPRHE
ncbi:MAG: class I SAM-dependent methyltransferase [bacterium]|nr:class I SAM-dependent methyltransferase [bacterium]